MGVSFIGGGNQRNPEKTNDLSPVKQTLSHNVVLSRPFLSGI